MVCMIRLLWSNSMKHRDRLAHVAKRPRTISYTPRNTSDAKFDSSITWFLYFFCVFFFYYYFFFFCKVKYGLKISRFNLVLVVFFMCRTYRSIYMYIRMNSYSTNLYDPKSDYNYFVPWKIFVKKIEKSAFWFFFISFNFACILFLFTWFYFVFIKFHVVDMVVSI